VAKGVRAGGEHAHGEGAAAGFGRGSSAFPALCSQTASEPPDDGGLGLFHPFITGPFALSTPLIETCVPNRTPSPADSSPFLTTPPNRQSSMKWGENDGLILSN